MSPTPLRGAFNSSETAGASPVRVVVAATKAQDHADLNKTKKKAGYPEMKRDSKAATARLSLNTCAGPLATLGNAGPGNPGAVPNMLLNQKSIRHFHDRQDTNTTMKIINSPLLKLSQTSFSEMSPTKGSG